MKEIFRTSNGQHFFGYYDKCPWSRDERFLLAHRVNFLDRLPDGHDIAEIGVIDWHGERTFRKLAETRAWNFQQGAMLQWLGPDFNERIIFNDLRDGKFVAVIFNVKENNEEKVVAFPVYAVHPDGTQALSVDFSRFDKIREGYGYKGGMAIDHNSLFFRFELDALDDRVDFYDGTLHGESLDYEDPGGNHWADHLAFNPSGTKFAFLHRQQLRGGGFSSWLCLSNSDGKIVTLLESGMASHFSWKNDEGLVVWGRPPGLASTVGKSFLRKTAARVYHNLVHSAGMRQRISGDAFLLFNTRTLGFRRVGKGILTEDGHATFSPDGKWMLTDTYADTTHYRTLSLFNMDSEELVEIGKLYALPNGYSLDSTWDSSGVRADLHPRFSRDGKKICIDSVHSDSRQMHVFDVSDIVER